MGFLKGTLGLDDGCVFLPFLAADVHTDITQFLVIAHRGIVYEVNPQLGTATVGYACPYREAVFLATFHTHTEESTVLHHGVLVVMTRGSQTYIVGILVEGAVILQRDFA